MPGTTGSISEAIGIVTGDHRPGESASQDRVYGWRTGKRWHRSCYAEYNYHNMITFSYQARDASGKIVSGIQDALNEDNAVTSLMSRGLMVLSLQQKAAASKSRKKTWSVKETDLVLFTRQLSTMIEAGISLVQALTALYDQCDPKRQKSLRHIISDVTTRVQGGETFNESIAKHPRVFDRLFVSMVKAGEHGGLLAEILDRLAGFLEASARLRKKIKSRSEEHTSELQS